MIMKTIMSTLDLPEQTESASRNDHVNVTDVPDAQHS